MHADSNDAGGKAGDQPGPVKEDGRAMRPLLRKLLLVDDEADGAEFAAVLLRAHGLQVTVVHSAVEALKVLEGDQEIDAVLTDVMMPDMSGLELAEIVCNRYPAMKIVLMSGYVSPRLLDEQQHTYLFASKPYRIDSILALLHS